MPRATSMATFFQRQCCDYCCISCAPRDNDVSTCFQSFVNLFHASQSHDVGAAFNQVFVNFRCVRQRRDAAFFKRVCDVFWSLRRTKNGDPQGATLFSRDFARDVQHPIHCAVCTASASGADHQGAVRLGTGLHQSCPFDFSRATRIFRNTAPKIRRSTVR